MGNTRYENFVLKNKLEEILLTKLGLSQFLTVDRTLAANEGMTIKINRYNCSGGIQDVLEGQGNTDEIEMTYDTEQYIVGTTQGRFAYTDEDAMTDSFLVDGGITDLAKKFVNDFNEKAVAEWTKATRKVYTSKVVFDNFVDAIAALNLEDAEENGFNALVHPSMKAALRKNLADELKYVEDYARVGYVGSVCGIPIYTSRAVPMGSVLIANKEAVTAFMKKDTEIEQEREVNIRKNWVYARNVKVIALTHDDKAVQILVGAAGYAMLHEKPSDWDTAFTSYYMLDEDGDMTAITGTIAPIFEDGKYYKAV